MDEKECEQWEQLLFTFQPGYIQIKAQAEIEAKINTLYIPTWLYSNGFFISFFYKICKLYIPTWLYSNAEQYRLYTAEQYLYTPTWLYSNETLKKHYLIKY